MHYDGDPNGCSETCTGPHLDDLPAGAPDVCGSCGGNARACWPVCTDTGRGRPFEPFEGRTGAQEYAEAL